MLFFSWIVCLLILGATLALGRRGRYGGVLAVQAAFFVGPPLCLMGIFTPVIWLTIALAILAIVASARSMQPQPFVRSAAVVTGITLLANMGYGLWRHQETIDRRREFAFEAIESRLPAALVPENSLGEGAGPEVLSRLEMQEHTVFQTDPYGEGRAQAIQRLHENTVQQFINSPGFGATRMSGWDQIRMRTDDPGPIPQPQLPPPQYIPDAALDGGLEADAVPSIFGRDALQGMHTLGVADFVNPSGFGYRDASGRVAGFESHRFSEIPTEKLTRTLPWTLARVELVSLLMSSEPRVYLSDHLPRMDELREAPTREPRDFEAAAVANLRRGDDLVTHQDGSQLFVVGSLRAGKQCLDCHQGRRGDLLGAFTYEFRLLQSAIDGGG
jgi:hypothetical protein